MSESKSLSTTETNDITVDDNSTNEIAAVMRWIVIVGVIFAAVAFLMGSLAGKVSVHSPLSASTGGSTYPPPDFRLATLDGQTLGPLDFPGQVVVVDLWASWCGPCSLQAKFLEELSAEFAGQGVQVLAVNVGEDEATVRNHLAKNPYSYPVLLDPSDTLGAKYQVVGLPTVMVINRDGVITFMKTGVTDLPTLRQKVQAAGGPAPANI